MAYSLLRLLVPGGYHCLNSPMGMMQYINGLIIYKRKGIIHIVAYVIMPSHVHAVIAFSTSRISINTIIGNGKRFMAYWLVTKLTALGNKELLAQLAAWVNNSGG